MENLLTPDSETPDSTDQEMSYSDETPSKDVWMTPKHRRVKGVDFPICSRRINFDLAEEKDN